MKLFIGLGNPGKKHKNNRHNTGFAVVDKLQTEISKSKFLISKKIQIFKSKNFMNDSGSFVSKLINHYSLAINHLYVVHDDLDLPLGSWKIQLGKGPKDHGGINDIEQKLGTKDFWRVRVGIDPTTSRSGGTTRGKDYVLEDFLPEEREILDLTINKLLIDLINLISKSK